MGFFSSRKAEPTPLPASEDSSVKVIRSRFFYQYGKNKNTSGRPSSILSVAPHSPLPSLPTLRDAAVPSQSPPSSGRQVSADALTMSLAERLNELAVANADKLLNDEEYRLLRQNLFERFSAGSDIPTETPVVPVVGTRVRADSHRHLTRCPSIDSQRSITSTMSSFFRRATGRSNPLASPTLSTSVSVGGSGFSLQQRLGPAQDSASIYSRPSFSSGQARSVNYPQIISRQRSDESLTSQAGSTSGSVISGLRGIVSRHRIVGGNSGNYASSISSRTTTRSAKPPSSFHLRQPVPIPRVPTRTHEDDEDENPKSSTELREEIKNVESEGRKLLDAFNGLELTALTKSRAVGPVSPPLNGNPNLHRPSNYSETTSFSTVGSPNILIPERTISVRKQAHGQMHALPLVSRPINLKRKPSVVNSITESFKSSTSDLRSGFVSSVPPSLHSSHSSPNLLVIAPSPPPPLPALPISASTPSMLMPKRRPSIMRQQKQFIHGTTATLNVSRGPPPQIAPVSQASPRSNRPSVPTDPTLHALEAELADIRRRKADVSLRYERRLEFLRAKLKSAEIRERLTKK